MIRQMGKRSLAGCASAWPGFSAALGVALGHPKPGGGFSVSELRHSHGQLEKHTLLLPKHHLR